MEPLTQMTAHLLNFKRIKLAQLRQSAQVLELQCKFPNHGRGEV